MAALVQSFPQQSSTVTMLQARPTSASGTFQNGAQGQQLPHSSRSSQMPRTLYSTTGIGGIGAGTYRGHTSLSPIAPYTFTSTPGLANAANPLRQNPTTPHLRQENRTSSAPVNPYSQPKATDNARQRYPATSSVSTTSSSSSDPSSQNQQITSRDDASVPTSKILAELNNLPGSTANMPSTVSNLQSPLNNASSKPSPDRYRRVQRRVENNVPDYATQPISSSGSAMPSGSGMATVGHLYNHPTQSSSAPILQSYQSSGGHSSSQGTRNHVSQGGPGHAGQIGATSVDDMHLYRQPATEQAKRYRRRSVSGIDSGDYSASPQDQGQIHAAHRPGASRQNSKEWRTSPGHSRPHSSHGRSGSTESTASAAQINSRPSSIKRDSTVSVATANPASLQGTPISKHEAKLVNIPPRGSSDANKRLTNPSPLSKPVAMSPQAPSSKESFSNPKQIAPQRSTTHESSIPVVQQANNNGAESPATQHLAALNDKEEKKGVKSRLRRAFSFGSAAELRKASAENNLNNSISAERARLRKERYQDEREAEQAAIAQKQEEGGIGEGIYSGQGNFFTGSTDNLSISSTASSASVMIRKMGKGMKKSSRSLVGLFRPKSVIGVPAADTAVPEPSVAQVSMVTVEAEREKVNVNANPHDQVGGGTGFPKLERNSIDAATASCKETRVQDAERESNDHSRGRRSIVGSEKERADVLAAVKKGILKRTDSGNSSPTVRAIDGRSTDFVLPNIPHISDSPNSSAPSTPGDDHHARSGHRRTDSVTIEGEDYFMSMAKFPDSASKSAPTTPQILARNISFSPRIQFHDTWPSMEYDRRGEIATCNRLTPMLAQQIKEELNSFKMEMEVHEQSKVYTHFF
ncbi:MAG: bud neck involved protein [Pycnora praestabilis]|nr:MAG: bud neck involved protein [Pycnora praestabilis]